MILRSAEEKGNVMGEIELERLTVDTIESYNRSDWEHVRELLDDDVVYDEVGSGNRMIGADELLASLRAWKAAVPDAEGEITRILSDGDTVVAEITWRGTQDGPLESPSGTLPPSGRSFTMDAVMIQRWIGGRVVHQRQHIDLLAMLTQIGAISASA